MNTDPMKLHPFVTGRLKSAVGVIPYWVKPFGTINYGYSRGRTYLYYDPDRVAFISRIEMCTLRDIGNEH